MGLRFGGIVANMDYRPASLTPTGQKQGCLFLRVPIVAQAPIAMIDCPLKIDQQQDRAGRKFACGPYVATGLSGANNPTVLCEV